MQCDRWNNLAVLPTRYFMLVAFHSDGSCYITCGVEFDFGEAGTVTIDRADANHGPFSHTTGWTACIDNAGIVSCKGSTQHAPTTRGPHKVFVDSKLALDEQGLMQILDQYDVLVRHTPLAYDTSG